MTEFWLVNLELELDHHTHHPPPLPQGFCGPLLCIVGSMKFNQTKLNHSTPHQTKINTLTSGGVCQQYFRPTIQCKSLVHLKSNMKSEPTSFPI